jgi:hypothetical protein
MQQVEVKLDEVHVKFNQHKDEAYKLNFNIITFHKTYDSNFSSTKGAKPQEQDSSFVSWQYDLKKEHLHLPIVASEPAELENNLKIPKKKGHSFVGRPSPNNSLI